MSKYEVEYLVSYISLRVLRRKERSIYERASTRHITAKRQALASRDPEF